MVIEPKPKIRPSMDWSTSALSILVDADLDGVTLDQTRFVDHPSVSV
jgi:hypothetical protein